MLQNISREQETRRPSIYYPVHVKEKCFAAYPLLKQYGCTECEELGKCLESVQLISKELECSYEEAEFIKSTIVLDISMDELLYDAEGEEDKDGFILSNFPANSILCEEDMYLLIRSGLVSEEISKILEVLTQKEREIVNLRFGLNGRPHTLDEIGHMRNLTRERIRQIEKNALRKLKRQAKRTSLAELYFG